MKQERVEVKPRLKWLTALIYAVLFIIGLCGIGYGGLLLDRMEAEELTAAN